MSKQIENNVVQMTFDNKDFEKNISTSSKSIEKLNEQLQFKDANKGFQDLEKYANSINFDGLNKAISNINSVFTVTGNLSKKIIDDIAGYFESKITGAISYVTGQTKTIMDFGAGMTKYESYTNSMSTLSANLTEADRAFAKHDIEMGDFDSELEYIEDHMDRILAYTDETSYNFTSMVDTIAKFTSSNVPLQQATSAIMGMANVAAVAGQNADLATTSMFQLAQSFGTGYVKYQDWAQAFTSKNIVTKELKETLIDAAVRVGTIDKDDLEAARKANKDNYADFFFTSEMLGQGWLRTSDVLIEGLKEYSKASDYILANMERVGEDVSVTNLLKWQEDFVKSGKTAKEFVASLGDSSIEDSEALVEILEELSKKEYELSIKSFRAAQQATNFHESIKAVADAVQTKMMKAFTYLIGDLDQARVLWTNFSNSLWDIFAGPLDNTLDGLKRWNKELTDVQDENGEFLTRYEIFWESIGRIFTAVGDFFGGFVEQLRWISGSYEETKDGTIRTVSIISKYTFAFMDKLTRGVSKLADILEGFLESDFYNNIVSSFAKIIKSIISIKNIVAKFIGKVVYNILKNMGGPLTEISEFLVEITSKIAHFLDTLSKSDRLNKFIESISRLAGKLTELTIKVLGALLKIVGKLAEKVGGLLGKLMDKLEPVIDWFIDAIDKYLIPAIDYVIDAINAGLGPAIDWLKERFDDAVDAVKNFSENVLGISFDDLEKKFKDFTKFVKDNFGDKAKGVFDIFGQYVKDSFDPNTKGTFGDLFNRLADANSLADGAKTTLDWTGDMLMRPVELILDIAGKLMGKDLSGLATAIRDFIKSFTDTLADIAPNAFEIVGKVADLLIKILVTVAKVIGDIIQVAFGMKKSTGFEVLDDIIFSIGQILSVVVDVFVYLLTSLAKVAKYIGPGVKKVIELVGTIFKNIIDMVIDMFKQFASVKDPSELLSYMWKMAKFFIGFLIIMKVLTVIMAISSLIKKVNGAANLVADGVDTLAGGLNNIANSLAGNTFGGLLRIFAVLMFSFGYALSKTIEASKVLQNKENLKGFAIALGAMLLVLMIFVKGVKSIINFQNKEMKKYLTSSLFDDTEKAVVTSYKGIAPLIMSLGIALIGIAAAVKILANAAHATSKGDLVIAALGVAVLIAAIALFLKLVKVQNNMMSTMEKTKGSKSKYSNDTSQTYKGVAKVLFTFAVSIMLIAIPMSLLAHTVETAGIANWWNAIAGILAILTIIGATLVLVSTFGKDLPLTQAFGFTLIIGKVTKMIIALGLTIAGLGIVFSQFVDKSAYKQIMGLAGIIAGVIVAVMAAITIIMAVSKETVHQVNSNNSINFKFGDQLAEALQQFSRFFTIGYLIKQIAKLILTISVSFIALAAACKYLFKGSNTIAGVPVEIVSAFVMIGGLVTIMMILIKKIVSSSMGTGKGKTAIAKLGGVAIIIFTMIPVIWTIVGAILSLSIATKGLGKNAVLIMWNSVLLIGAIGAILFLLMKGMVNIASGLKNTKASGSSAEQLLKIGLALVIVSGSLLVMAKAVTMLATAAQKMSGGDILKTLALVGIALGALAGVVLIISLAAKLCAPAINLLANSLKGLVLVLALGMAAIVLCMLFGDQVINWMNDNKPKIVEFFKSIGEAFIAMFLGLFTGLNEQLPELLTQLEIFLRTILTWLKDNVGWISLELVLILAKILNGIGDGLVKYHEELANGIMKILKGLLEIIFELMMQLSDEYYKCLVTAWGNPQDELHETMLKSEDKLQRELFEIRKESALAYQGILDKMVEACLEAYEEMANIEQNYGVVDEFGNITNTMDIIRGQQKVNQANQQYEKAKKTAKDKYDVTYDEATGNITSRYLGEFEENYDYRQNKYKDEAAKDTKEIIETIQDTADKEMGRHSPATWFIKFAQDCIAGFKKGSEGESEEAGRGVSNGIINGLQGALSGLTGGGNILSALGISSDTGSVLGSVMGNNAASSFITNFTAGTGSDDIFQSDMTNLDYSDMMTVPDINDLYGGSELDYTANLDTNVTDRQINQLSGSVSDSNEELIEQVKTLNNKMDEYTRALRNIQMYLDTGALVGELIVPIDKELGKKSDLRERRGV